MERDLRPLVYPDNSVLSRLSGVAPAVIEEAALVRRIVDACDDHWLRRASRIASLPGITLLVVTPAELVRLEGLP